VVAAKVVSAAVVYMPSPVFRPALRVVVRDVQKGYPRVVYVIIIVRLRSIASESSTDDRTRLGNQVHSLYQ
jgi:hypothetical protein